jgi:hypothetical protein
VCNDCGDTVSSEIKKLYNNTHCEFCTFDFDKMCKLCVEKYDARCKSLKSRYNSKPEYISIRTHERQMVNFLHKYNICTIDELTPARVAEVVKERCGCNSLCKCARTSEDAIKNKYSLEFVLYEVYDEATDYCVSKCLSCMIEYGIQIHNGQQLL